MLVIASEGEADPWIELGADDILAEPFVAAVVRDRINARLALKRRSAREVEHSGEIGQISSS